MPAPFDPDVHATRIAEHGYTVLENVLDDGLVRDIDQTLRRLERELAVLPSSNSFEGERTVRIYNLLAHGRVFEQIPVHPQILPVVERVLDAGCLVSSLSSISIDPGEAAQPIHADDQLIPVAKPHAPLVCNTMWAITDFTAENGATRILPGTHLRDRSPSYGKHYASIPAEMPRGSVLIWHGSLWHGGGANRSSQRRVGVAMNYCAGFMRQQENQQLGLPASLVRTFPPRLQELCGFGIYNGLIGHIDKKSPCEVILGTKNSDPIVWDA